MIAKLVRDVNKLNRLVVKTDGGTRVYIMGHYNKCGYVLVNVETGDTLISPKDSVSAMLDVVFEKRPDAEVFTYDNKADLLTLL